MAVFIVALTTHRVLGHICVPYLVEYHTSCFMVRSLVRPGDLDKGDYPFSGPEKEIVRLAARYADSKLAARYARDRTSQDFFSTVTPETVRKSLLPYVHQHMLRVLQLLREANVPFYEKEPNYSHIYEDNLITVTAEDAAARFIFRRHAGGTDYSLELSLAGKPIRILNRDVKVLIGDPCVLVTGNQLLFFKGMGAKKIQPFLVKEVVTVKPEVEPAYYRNFVEHIIRDHVIVAEGFSIICPREKPVAVLSLEPDLSLTPVLVLRFRYGEKECLPNDSRRAFVKAEYQADPYAFYKYTRDDPFEKEMKDFLVLKGLKEGAGSYTLPNLNLAENQQAVHYLVHWLSANHQELAARQVEIRQDALDKVYFTGRPELSFELKNVSDWFDVFAVARLGEFRFPFIRLRKYLLNDIREFELPDGTIAILPDEWFSRYRELAHFARGEGNLLNFSKHHYTLLHRFMPELVTEFSSLTEELSGGSLNHEVPDGLKVPLRNYQKVGFRWMYALYKNGFGGCLADDMGLGKTLQTLALLMKIKRLRKIPLGGSKPGDGQLSLFNEDELYDEQPPSLIVLPTSLVHNWRNEIMKYAPSIKVYSYIGQQRKHSQGNGGLNGPCDVILTTYGIVRNDIELFRDTAFHCLILDESQYIKNHTSKTYKAVMDLNARHRFVLTGTPVENSLSDLWSQMNFLNKGLLGSYPFFKQNFLLPVETRGDEEVAAKLRLMIQPFILRRTKDQVASDLPPLMEQTIHCPMSAGQESVYEQEKSKIRNSILASIESKGMANSALVILRGMTRLRQIANHPALVEEYTGEESGKFSMIIESLENLVSEKQKVLVFSSFVSHLELIREKLDHSGTRYSMLTGKSRNREEIIRDFQEESQNFIFLISLKAGGVGLNLTAAGYVFILDPWWNPAVEEQALSRAHRIGQEKHVFVYRFITENSIEEKIEVLKDKKSVLAEQFINQNNPFKAIRPGDLMALFG